MSSRCQKNDSQHAKRLNGELVNDEVVKLDSSRWSGGCSSIIVHKQGNEMVQGLISIAVR